MNYSNDPELFSIIEKEGERQRNVIELIASENFVSDDVMDAMGSILTNKYAEGYPGNRYYGGCRYVDEVEQLAIDRAKKLFGAQHANVQPHCGSQANMAAYASVLKPGDTILSMSLNSGGHLTHSSPVSFVSKQYKVVTYDVGEDGLLNYDDIYDQAILCRPKLIVAGASAYPRIIDFAKFREIADFVGAYLMVDMAHIAGLVAAGMHSSPVPYADIVTATTHKTLRGPRGGLILCREELSKQVDKAVFPGTQGGPLMHVIAGKAVCFGEALNPSFKKYQEQIVKNAKAMERIFKGNEVDMVTGGTDNHLILLDLRKEDISGKQLQEWLELAGIATNKNAIPNDPRSYKETSGLRIGTPAMTTRGMKEDDFIQIANCICDVITFHEQTIPSVQERVGKLLRNLKK